tara:strand:+ start:211 stop:960 length:750 start_codon:yes stop_codon:yes gene_type:complete
MIIGLTKVRNEEEIITATLDNWAEHCDAIHVYDDASTDDTVALCRKHPAVVEVVTSDCLDPDRLRAEWYNRNLILQSALRFNPDWVCYFDADEWLYDFDDDAMDDPRIVRIDCPLYDVHITPEDVDSMPSERQWIDPTPRVIGFFFRAGSVPLYYDTPDQRIMHHARGGRAITGRVKHFGKGWSVAQWEKKCNYYADVFGHPAYIDKWRARRGKAIKADYKSDTGDPLIRWDDEWTLSSKHTEIMNVMA